MKQKKTKTECLRGHTVFVLIVIKLDPLRSHFINSFISFLVFGNPHQTLALLCEILVLPDFRPPGVNLVTESNHPKITVYFSVKAGVMAGSS